jgi:hypothetical protein
VKSWRAAWHDGNQAGALASLLSAAVLAEASRRETGSPFACLNATSHWIWGGEAAGHQSFSLRYTVNGYLIHHAASCFWGVLYERGVGEQMDHLPASAKVAAGLAAAGFACLVDYRVVPRRLSPGFELRLSRRSIAAGYLAFGLGIALAGMARAERKARHAQEDRQVEQPTCAASGRRRPAETA